MFRKTANLYSKKAVEGDNHEDGAADNTMAATNDDTFSQMNAAADTAIETNATANKDASAAQANPASGTEENVAADGDQVVVKKSSRKKEVKDMYLHVHGDACLEHEAGVVLDGIKYVLRTDMVFSSA